jgi:hypothetical protein
MTVSGAVGTQIQVEKARNSCGDVRNFQKIGNSYLVFSFYFIIFAPFKTVGSASGVAQRY